MTIITHTQLKELIYKECLELNKKRLHCVASAEQRRNVIAEEWAILLRVALNIAKLHNQIK